MHKCIVSFNTSNKTRVNRPGVIYHGEEHIGNAVVNNFKSPTRSSRLTRNNEDNALPVSINEVPVMSTCEDQLISPIDNETGEQSPEEKNNNVKELKNRLNPGAIPSLFLDNAPNALPMSINEVPVMSTCEDQLICPIDNETAEQSPEEKNNNVKDNTDNTSMTIDLAIDDSSNSSLSIRLEPIENKTSQCIMMDVCNTEDFTRNEHEIISEMSKEVVLPSIYWKCEHLPTKNRTTFYQRGFDDETVKTVTFNNNLVPTIQVYGIKYEHKTPITTRDELDNLLEKVDSIEKCDGRSGLVFDQCLGYVENSLVTMCSGCEGLVKDSHLQRMKAKLEAKNKNIESFQKKIAEQKKMLLKLKKYCQKFKY